MTEIKEKTELLDTTDKTILINKFLDKHLEAFQYYKNIEFR